MNKFLLFIFLCVWAIWGIQEFWGRNQGTSGVNTKQKSHLLGASLICDFVIDVCFVLLIYNFSLFRHGKL